MRPRSYHDESTTAKSEKSRLFLNGRLKFLTSSNTKAELAKFFLCICSQRIRLNLSFHFGNLLIHPTSTTKMLQNIATVNTLTEQVKHTFAILPPFV